MSQSNTDGLGSLLDVGSVGVTLDIFEGPLDLLLHLVKSKEVSIDKVDLSEVVDQYCRLVAESEILNLDVLTEYAVVAANLISIKGKVLARIQTDFSLIPGDASDLDKDSFKSLEELRERIKAYELTKQRAGLLVETKQIGVDSFMRKPFKKVDYDHQPENAGILGSMYATFLSRLGGLDRRLNFEME